MKLIMLPSAGELETELNYSCTRSHSYAIYTILHLRYTCGLLC